MTDPLAVVRRICLSLPEVEERVSHGHPAWFVRGGRQFASFHGQHHELKRPHLWCAAPPGAQEWLMAERPAAFFRPKYVGHRGWLGVYLDAGASEGELEGLLVEAHRVSSPPRLRAALDGASSTGGDAPPGL